MTDRAQLNQEALLNRNPLNQACLKVLPPDWQGGTGLHVLALMRWGLDNLRLEPRQNGLPLDEDVEAQAVVLESGSPAWALKWLTRDREGDFETLTAQDLEGLNLEEAARTVVVQLQDQILSR